MKKAKILIFAALAVVLALCFLLTGCEFGENKYKGNYVALTEDEYDAVLQGLETTCENAKDDNLRISIKKSVSGKQNGISGKGKADFELLIDNTDKEHPSYYLHAYYDARSDNGYVTIDIYAYYVTAENVVYGNSIMESSWQELGQSAKIKMEYDKGLDKLLDFFGSDYYEEIFVKSVHDLESFIGVLKTEGTAIYHDGENKIKLEYTAEGNESFFSKDDKNYVAYAVTTDTGYSIQLKTTCDGINAGYAIMPFKGNYTCEISSTKDTVELPDDLDEYSEQTYRNSSGDIEE